MSAAFRGLTRSQVDQTDREGLWDIMGQTINRAQRLDDNVRPFRGPRAHLCPSDVLITITLPGAEEIASRWCLWCLEDADPVDSLLRFLPASSISVRAGA